MIFFISKLGTTKSCNLCESNLVSCNTCLTLNVKWPILLLSNFGSGVLYDAFFTWHNQLWSRCRLQRQSVDWSFPLKQPSCVWNDTAFDRCTGNCKGYCATPTGYGFTDKLRGQINILYSLILCLTFFKTNEGPTVSMRVKSWLILFEQFFAKTFWGARSRRYECTTFGDTNDRCPDNIYFIAPRCSTEYLELCSLTCSNNMPSMYQTLIHTTNRYFCSYIFALIFFKDSDICLFVKVLRI